MIALLASAARERRKLVRASSPAMRLTCAAPSEAWKRRLVPTASSLARGDLERGGHRARRLDHRSAQRGVGWILLQLLQRGFERGDRGVDARLFERGFGIAETAHFRIGARSIRSGAAHFGLTEGIGVAHDTLHPDARERHIVDRAGDNRLRTLRRGLHCGGHSRPCRHWRCSAR